MTPETQDKINHGHWIDSEMLDDLLASVREAWGEAERTGNYWYEVDVVDLHRLLLEVKQRREQEAKAEAPRP